MGVPDTYGSAWVSAASTDTPRNITPRIVLISTRVVRAFRAWGTRKMLTPLEMASVPVMAELPWAKARRRKKAEIPRMRPPDEWPSGMVPGDWGAWGSPVVTSLTSPATMRIAMLAMKK